MAPHGRNVAATVVALAMVGIIGAGHAHADPCSEAFERRQPVLAKNHPAARLAERIWTRLYTPFFKATARKTDFVALAPEALMSNGQPFPRIAMACARRNTHPAVVVTWPFLESLEAQGVFDEDFLALIIGHELGHRHHDFEANGRWRGPADEGRADQRGAFLAASVGYATHRLVCENRIDAYLDAEGVREENRDKRKAALPEVLRRFEAWEAVYGITAGLAFAAPQVAVEVLDVTRHELARLGESVPEMLLLEAISLIQQGATEGCWQSIVGDEYRPNDHLRCIPVFASHTSLRPPSSSMKGLETRGSCDANAPANMALRRALTLLDELDADIVGAAAYHGAKACAHLYLAEIEAALEALKLAEAAIGEAPAPEIRLAMTSNRALLGWLAWSTTPENRMPFDGQAPSLATWRKKLATARKAFAGHAELDAWLDGALGKPFRPRQSGKVAMLPRCPDPLAKKSAGAVWSPTTLPPIAARPPAGGCPCGWVEYLAWKDPDAVRADKGMLRLCRPAEQEPGGIQHHLDVHLPLRGFETQVHLFVPGAGPLADVGTWRGACDTVTLAGVSDRGTMLWDGRCSELGAGRAIFESDGCHVRRVVRVGVP